ncbi:hypothetical protein INS49_002813 [Diaporthe citri]|uniref:uncharacterized protein n=1 Tax=Diaporthe citri TaxID=83186 RepID=UPI001C7F32A2|nr:uncharacterized protein INS49_002813 [Diaporthe citri]KAG6368600.1 hypothetical protein INS49_002813 [Diaporthe citri]
MADDNHLSGGSADHHDPDNGCRDTQLVLIEPDKHVNQPASGPSFHSFPPSLGAAKDGLGICSTTKRFHISDTVSQDLAKFGGAISVTTSITNETDIYIRTWFSPKLDTLTLDPVDLVLLGLFAEDARCDLINSLGSPTTCLLVHDWSRTYGRLINPVYQQYIKSRDKILLNIGDVRFVLKDKVWDIETAAQALGTVEPGAQVIHLNDTAALCKGLELWEHCCQYETTASWANKHCDVGAWLKMAIDEGKREGARGWMRRYKAWVVEEQAYEKRLVSPEAYYVLRLADHILSAPGLRPNRHCGHEIVDYTGRLKKDHPLVGELDIKMPEIIPVCTINILGRCCC